MSYVKSERYLKRNLRDIESAIAPPVLSSDALKRKASAALKASIITELKSVTAEQAAAYIDTSVKDLASAKTVLKLMVRLLIALRDEAWPDLQDKY